MTIYGISGLGADERVFQYLKLSQRIQPIHWIQPFRGESLKSYALRLSEQIKAEDFILIGVSFGGLIAIEISKVLNPKKTILISSAETRDDLRWIHRLLGRIGIVNLIPSWLLKPPKYIAYWVFGAKNKELLGEILTDTNLEFAKWALIQLIGWENKNRMGAFKIHGTKDKLIPYHPNKLTMPVHGGQHFMIVDRAEEVSEIIELLLKE